jgi:putative acetyltransferase
MTKASPAGIRPQRPDDEEQVGEVIAKAFGRPVVVALEEALARRPDSHGFVAEVEGQVVGHVRLTRGWIDAEERLVDVLVLSPLSVLPAFQRRGIGGSLVRHAVEQAAAARAPAVFLEGSPDYDARLGWRPAAELGVTPPSVRIPGPAFQVVRLDAWDDSMRGGLVYAEPFWTFDCVGLRGDRLQAARERLERAHAQPRERPDR